MALKLGVFAKAPVPGQSKSRLAASIGEGAAAALAEAFIEDVVRSALPHAEVTLFVTDEHPVFTRLGREVEVRPQSEGDLGRRMHVALEALNGGALIGSDVVALPPRILHAAAAEAGPSFSPSGDGGFVLVSGRPNFADVRWSSPHTLSDTLARNPHATLLEPWFDVDTRDDLRLLATVLALDPTRAPRTAELLAGGVLGA